MLLEGRCKLCNAIVDNLTLHFALFVVAALGAVVAGLRSLQGGVSPVSTDIQLRGLPLKWHKYSLI